MTLQRRTPLRSVSVKKAEKKRIITTAESVQDISPILTGSLDWDSYFHYDDSSGDLFWKKAPIERFPAPCYAAMWNTRCAGKLVGTKNPITDKLSVRIKIGSAFRKVFIHRIIWEMHYGQIPEGMQIDHWNGIGSDNRICNLRLATLTQNRWNVDVRKKGPMPRGVRTNKAGKSFWACIRHNKRTIRLGVFPSPELAHAAYVEASKRLHGDFAFVNRPPSR